MAPRLLMPLAARSKNSPCTEHQRHQTPKHSMLTQPCKGNICRPVPIAHKIVRHRSGYRHAQLCRLRIAPSAYMVHNYAVHKSRNAGRQLECNTGAEHACMLGYRLVSSWPYMSHAPTVFSRSCTYKAFVTCQVHVSRCGPCWTVAATGNACAVAGTKLCKKRCVLTCARTAVCTMLDCDRNRQRLRESGHKAVQKAVRADLRTHGCLQTA